MQFQFDKLRAGLLVGALSLTGCAGMTQVRPTAVPLQANALAPGAEVRQDAANGVWPDAAWWRQYGDPQLNRLVDSAIEANPRVEGARARVAAAQALARVSSAALAPQVDAGGEFDLTRFTQDQYIPSDINGHDLFKPLFNNSTGVSLAYDFDFWGRDRAALNASLDRVKVSEYEAQGARLTLEGAVIHAYADLAYEYEIEDHGKAILATEKQTLDLANRRLKAGLGTELEVEQASDAVAATQARLVEIANRMTLLRHQLAALTGAGPGAGDALVRPAVTMVPNVGLPSTIPAELIGRRPDVQAERWRVESAARDIEVAKAAFYPNVNLKGVAGFVGIGFGQLLTEKALNASVGPAITLPIFEGGRLRAGLDARISQYDMAVDAYNAAVVESLHEVADQISRLNSLKTLQIRREETRAFAERANELALIAFRAGLTDYVNVLSTEDALHRAENLTSEVGLLQIDAFAALNQALGGGMPAAGELPVPVPVSHLVPDAPRQP